MVQADKQPRCAVETNNPDAAAGGEPHRSISNLIRLLPSADADAMAASIWLKLRTERRPISLNAAP